jgi:hypothetical protein
VGRSQSGRIAGEKRLVEPNQLEESQRLILQLAVHRANAGEGLFCLNQMLFGNAANHGSGRKQASFHLTQRANSGEAIDDATPVG